MPSELYPISLSEAKSHLRVDATADDDLIIALIIAATEAATITTGRQLLRASRTLILDDFRTNDGNAIRIPYPPLVSITSIVYVDTNGDNQTWSADEYDVDIDSEPGRVTTAYNYSWPVCRDQINAVTFTYLCGYANAASVPELIKAGIKMFVAELYENRELSGPGKQALVPLAQQLWSMSSARDYFCKRKR